ncbi:MAG: MBL fold metallo-hydrolase [Anaerolineales bacterium]|jgi:glyoxylase-like metal-dependent hydrolase (beta-lactamase superfamily II)
MQVEQLNERLYKFELSRTGFNVNMIASIGRDGVLLVDTGWEATAEEVKANIDELSDDILKLIIITHPHLDHIGGRHLLGENATLISHKHTQDELAGKYYALGPLPGQELPTILIDDELSLHFNGEEIRIMPAPGHTSSDMVVNFVDSSVVHMGDLLFSESFPVLFPAWGGDADHFLATLKRLTDVLPADVKLIAGHGRDCSLEDLKAYHQMAVDTIGLIRQGMSDGKTVKELVEEDILKDWENLNSDTISGKDWIAQVFESLSGGAKPSISKPLTHTIMEDGIQAAIGQYHELKKTQPNAFNFNEYELNMLGYQLLWRDMNEAAIEMHKLNVQAYPDSSNPYDSLADAYEANGDVELAIKAYEKALEREPELSSAIEGLERLKPKDKKA